MRRRVIEPYIEKLSDHFEMSKFVEAQYPVNDLMYCANMSARKIMNKLFSKDVNV